MAAPCYTHEHCMSETERINYSKVYDAGSLTAALYKPHNDEYSNSDP